MSVADILPLRHQTTVDILFAKCADNTTILILEEPGSVNATVITYLGILYQEILRPSLVSNLVASTLLVLLLKILMQRE